MAPLSLVRITSRETEAEALRKGWSLPTCPRGILHLATHMPPPRLLSGLGMSLTCEPDTLAPSPEAHVANVLKKGGGWSRKLGTKVSQGWSRKLGTKVSQVTDPSHLPSGAEWQGRERRLMEVSPHPAGEGRCPEDSRYGERSQGAGPRERLWGRGACIL